MTDSNTGLELRRSLVGEERVDRAMAQTDSFNAPIQEYLNEHVWAAVWSRDGLSLKTRSLVVVSCLIALHRPRELALHVRAAVRNGWTLEELREVVLQTAAYCGAPAAVEATRVINEALAEEIAAAGSD